ncbi:hypothetical protein E1162_16210 [Rhodobacteraceae bacterium RKSG542]|uniref:FUSC family protein n=1 Tax=Pseudovibrio flavus TaxID=2529854 RepID=UPI0012BBB753|nr:FUSC family protein [Pseudovibrio flavus]MTI18791.1 hypothetical protein [Pseudovibrio flavus]
MALILRTGVKFGLTALLAYLAGYYFSLAMHPETALIGGLWAVISAIVVSDPDILAQNMQAARDRIIGSIIGSIFAAPYLLYLPFSAASFAMLVMLNTCTCVIFGLTRHVKLANITLAVIIIVSTVSNIDPVLNSVLRLVESILGIIAGVFVAFLFQWAAKLQK